MCTNRWSCRLNVFPQRRQTYFLSLLCVSLCLANALELLKTLPHIGHSAPDLMAPPAANLDGRPFFRGGRFVTLLTRPDGSDKRERVAPECSARSTKKIFSVTCFIINEAATVQFF